MRHLPKTKTKTKLKRGDMVSVIAGKDLGKEGKILSIDRVKNRAIVEGINLMTKHQKSNRTNQTGGIIRIESAINASNLMYLHKDKPTRLGYKVEVTEENGKRVVTKKRYAKSTGEIID
jgi:large subunit ribosomal protein L24